MNYKKIYIHNNLEIQNELLNYLRFHTKILEDNTIGFIPLSTDHVIHNCPLVTTFFKNIDLKPIKFNLYKTIKNGDSMVHIDTFEYHARVNIPILNCNYSVTKFFKARPKTVIEQKNKLPFILCDQHSAIEIEEFVLDMPTVFKVTSPHQVIMNDNYSPRISLTVKCDPDPIFLLRN